jgi:CBS domain-containing protein
VTIAAILSRKGDSVVTIGPEATVLEAMRLLMQHRIGGVVVVRDEAPVGILTERDVLRLGAEDPGQLATTAVETAMTRELITGQPEESLHRVMEVMTDNRIRHLPIVVDGKLTGIVSIGDVVNAARRAAENENQHLRAYIHGAG